MKKKERIINRRVTRTRLSKVKRMRITILKGALHICREIDIRRWPNGSDTHVGAKGEGRNGKM